MKLSYTLKDLEKVSKLIIKQATSKVLVFDAEMGMGKTTLIKALVKALGSNDTVSSPTFSLVNEYKADKQTIYHFDLYRVESEEELYDFGIEEYLNDEAWIFIEWPEIVKSLLPEHYTIIKIIQGENASRIINM